jgi:mannose-6-phosphate isomerase-like protein (cupin superfamily)
MRIATRSAVIGALLLVATAWGVRAGGEDKKAMVHISSKDGKWEAGPAPGTHMIKIQGDMTKGAYANFVKFPPGADHGWHTHTHDTTLVVLEGAYIYKDESGKTTRVGPGDYICVPGGLKHWSGGDEKQGVVFYQSGNDAFDLIKADAPKK